MKIKNKRNAQKIRSATIAILVIAMILVSTFGYAFAESAQLTSSQDTSVTATESSSQDGQSSDQTGQSQQGGQSQNSAGNGTQPQAPPDGSAPPTPPDGNPPQGTLGDGSQPPTPPDGNGASNGNSSESGSAPQGNPPEMPEGGSAPQGNPPDGAPNGAPGGQSSANVSYTGATEFTEDTTESGKTYTSENGSEQALLVTGGNSTIDNATINKTGDSDGDDADFYGTNAAVLVNSGTLNITNSNVTSKGNHANAVFATGEGVINISDSTVTTSSDCSGGIMVTGGGTLTADNLTVNTSGRSSAPIRSDRGGGTITVNGGTYESNGVGSPVVYSTADITVNNAKMTSNASEGIVVEGKNSVKLNGVELTADNNQLNGQSETYKGIFLYQSMSGDAEEGVANFSAKDSKINILNGDTIYVTNTTAEILLENNTITNKSGDLLRIEAAAWGNSGSNGGNVTMTMSNQTAEGNIIVDEVSTLDLSLDKASVLTGSIDSENQASKVNLTLSGDSVLVLTADTYVDTLTNEVSDNSNIYLNGHKLYVAGTETAANEGTYEGAASTDSSADDAKDTAAESDNSATVMLFAVCGLAVIGAACYVAMAKKRKGASEKALATANAEGKADQEEQTKSEIPQK